MQDENTKLYDYCNYLGFIQSVLTPFLCEYRHRNLYAMEELYYMGTTIPRNRLKPSNPANTKRSINVELMLGHRRAKH